MRLAPLILAASLSVLPAAAVAQQGLSGAYLAARQAVIDGDHGEAAFYFDRALAQDPGNLTLISNAILSNAALGNWTRALDLSEQYPRDVPGRDIAATVELAEMVRAGEIEAARAAIAGGEGAGPLLDDLVSAWLELGQGNMTGAVTILGGIAASPSPLAGIAQYHLALVRAAAGDFEGADEILSGREFGPQPATTRGIAAHAQILVQLDRVGDAMDLLDQTIAAAPDPGLIALHEEISADPARPYDFVVSPQEGVAEVFYSISRGLGGDNGTTLPLIYARAASHVSPALTEAQILAAEYLMEGGQPDLAAAAYRGVPSDDPLFPTAETGRADALFEMGRTDTAVEVLDALARDRPELANVHATLGDTLRRLERFDEAIDAYSAALDLVDTEQPRYWFIFYARGICYEQLDRWEEAEADLRQALVLSPGQPQVLNYLGYSLVEQRRNLDEALDMIERAVEAEPNSGYIVDSLAWVFYRLGRFEEAVDPMERAVELLPNDPIVNDHLGDVYWMVGRKLEAEFQWHRALSFDPEPEDAERIRLKLEIGLDAVLEAEGGVGAAE